jgi:hypothetical protein
MAVTKSGDLAGDLARVRFASLFRKPASRDNQLRIDR